MSAIRSASLALSLLTAAALPALAQEAACGDKIYDRPGQVKDANKTLTTAEVIGKPEDKRKAFIRAVTLLTKEPEKVRVNQTGANLVLGRALIDLATLPDMPRTVRRGDVGFTQDPDATIDLLATADSLLDAVEAQIPACKAETEGWRRAPYSTLVNDAVNAYNAQQIDSAEVLVRRSLMIYDNYPVAYFGYNILGNIQQAKDSMPAAIASFKKVAELMKGDTSVVDERKTTTILVAQLMIDQSEKMDSAGRAAAMTEVVAYLQEYLKEFPGDMKAQSAIATAQLKSGDVTAARRLFDEMLANPDKYTDLNLLEAGVGAARANQNAMAAQLFEAGLKKNPYSRDGLFNLATVYTDTVLKKLEEMPAVLKRLNEVDPENPDNAQLGALYWQARARALKAPAEGKDLPDPAAVAFKVANDSLLHYYEKFQNAKTKVTFNLFSHDEGRHVLAGSIENRGDEEKSYTIKFEFLDITGKVLETRDVAVEGVRGKSSKSFRVELTDKPGVAAFRYAPFPS
jgi:tetratricopeptide (TPR) repeat protein